MQPNSIKGDELYVRCIFCLDSKNPNHAHLCINLTSGLYHCFRCKAAGKVSTQLLFNLQITDFPQLDFQTKTPLPTILAGPGSARQSKLDRYHTEIGDDIFYSWWHDQHVGYYQRGSIKRLWGFSGMNWSTAPAPLVSSPEKPLYFVEGPYDVQGSNEVCFFGIPSIRKIYTFYREHYFILRLDGDLWTDQARFSILRALIQTLIKDNYGFLGADFLAKAKDPDQSNSKFIPAEFFKEKIWKNASLSLKAQQALARVR